MRKYVRRVAVKILYWTAPRWGERLMQVRPDDVFLVSYPKSGNTWMRFMLANLLYGDEKKITFDNIEQFVPEIHSYTARQLDQRASPRIMKSHSPFDRRYPRVVYLVRDPRDVAVSFYYYRRKLDIIPEDYSLERHVREFVDGRLHHGTWDEHVGGWLGGRERRGNFLWIRYEDIQEDAVRQLREAANFLNIDTHPADLRQAVEASTADRMRQLERSADEKNTAIMKGYDDMPFVRKARSGGWRDELPSSCAEQIEVSWGELMDRLGYL